jgi:glycosyltransferase involved in cell wall biosynthesis
MRTPPGDHVAVVIPALDEAGSLGGVLAAIAPEACGLPVEVVVVDDGSSDGTGEIARDAGAQVVTHATNQGQGAAFRSGYALARERGARYIVATSA